MGLAILVYLLTLTIPSNAQDGNAGINEATMRVRSYFTTGTSLMYAIGAILGLVGAIKVYQKWNSGDPDTGKVAAAWFGSCVFFGDRSNCAQIIFWSLIFSIMASSVYKINKGINKPIEFKGLKAQYIAYLGAGLIVLLILFAILYIVGVNMFVCLAFIGALGVGPVHDCLQDER